MERIAELLVELQTEVEDHWEFSDDPEFRAFCEEIMERLATIIGMTL